MSDIERFLISEIDTCHKRTAAFPSNRFNGVRVGFRKAKFLNDEHILYCKQLLNIIENDKGRQRGE